MSSEKEHTGCSIAQAPPRRCREAVCPNCSHRFMWIDGSEGPICPAYRRKDTGERLDSTVCPKCGEELVLFPGELTAAFPELDRRITRNCEKGV